MTVLLLLLSVVGFIYFVYGDAETGWSLTIDQTKNVPFNFLKKINAEKRKCYIVISYLAVS